MNVSCYLNKEETEFFKDYPKGWLKALVLKEMRTAASHSEEASQVDEEIDALAREHFPPKDVFGPRLKR